MFELEPLVDPWGSASAPEFLFWKQPLCYGDGSIFLIKSVSHLSRNRLEQTNNSVSDIPKLSVFVSVSNRPSQRLPSESKANLSDATLLEHEEKPSWWWRLFGLMKITELHLSCKYVPNNLNQK